MNEKTTFYSTPGMEEDFKINIKRVREATGLTQTEFADLLGVSRGAISYYEKGERTPDIEFLSRVCEVFDLSPNFMMGYVSSVREDFSIAEMTLGLSNTACNKMESDESIGMFISDLIEHENFDKLCYALNEILSNASKNNPKSINYDPTAEKVDTRYLGFLFGNLLFNIISEIIQRKYSAVLYKGYSDEELMKLINKNIGIQDIMNELKHSEDSIMAKLNIRQDPTAELRKKVHMALGDINYPK